MGIHNFSQLVQACEALTVAALTLVVRMGVEERFEHGVGVEAELWLISEPANPGLHQRIPRYEEARYFLSRILL